MSRSETRGGHGVGRRMGVAPRPTSGGGHPQHRPRTTTARRATARPPPTPSPHYPRPFPWPTQGLCETARPWPAMSTGSRRTTSSRTVASGQSSARRNSRRPAAGGHGEAAAVQAKVARIMAVLGVVSGAEGSQAGLLVIQKIVHIPPTPIRKHWHRPPVPGGRVSKKRDIRPIRPVWSLELQNRPPRARCDYSAP